MVDSTSKGQGEGWLALREASEKMGVSPATLRAWADEGRVPSYRTPGGHRRFRVSDSSAPFQKAKRGGDARWRLFETNVVGRIQLAREQSEVGRMSGDARKQERLIERSIIRLTSQALQRAEADLRDAARQVGVEFAKFNWRHDIAQGEGLAALGRMRSALTESVVEFSFGMGEPDMDELNAWLGRVNEIIDRVCVSMLEYRTEEPKTNAGR